MRILIFLFLLFSFTSEMQGQKNKTVRLKDGSFLRGKVISESADSLLIKLRVGDTISIAQNSLFSLRNSSKKKYAEFGNLLILKRGLYTHMYAGVLYGSTVSTTGFRRIRRGLTPFGLSIGYTFNEKWSFGGGFSIDFLQQTYFPLYFEARRNIVIKKITPYASVRLGYAGGKLNRSFRSVNIIGGPIFNPLIGLQVASKSRNNFSVEFGFRHQRDVSKTEFEKTIRQINRYTLSFGLIM